MTPVLRACSGVMIGRQVCLFFAFSVFAIALTIPTATAQDITGGIDYYSPCWHKPCHSYAKCEIINGSQAVCVCPNECPNLNKPVCGTDWKTYTNMCDLMTKTCKSNEWTQLRYYGECKAGDCSQTRWHHLRCPYYSSCRMNYGLPSCICPKNNCPSEYKPVCGTNGKTYRNACLLKLASCKLKKWLIVRNLGHCRPDPCQVKHCCCGAVCRVNETNHASCECDFACTQQYDPVCGSDGKTYGNACKLRSAACAQQNIRLVEVSKGKCLHGGLVVNPCATVKCYYYATCKVVNHVGSCVCPDLCVGVREPVCGSDGNTYDNECTLRVTSCTNQRSISVVKNGVCIVPNTPTPTPTPKSKPTIDLCPVGACSHYAKCEVVNGVAKCVCSGPCATVKEEVCGSDGKTYNNECILRATSCIYQIAISVAKNGSCIVPNTPTTTIDPCSNTQCAHYAKCEVEMGKPKCVCSGLCVGVVDPVCGSDGKTYANECTLRATSCADQRTISVAKNGACVVPNTPTTIFDPCSIGKCAYYAKCEVAMGKPKCVCPGLCFNVRAPVCGSDGKTYENECTLKRTSCKDQRTIRVGSTGACVGTASTTLTTDACATNNCTHYAKCEAVQGVAKCVCSSLCADVHEPVCGSDGVTYKNECTLKMISCKVQKNITVVNRGICIVPTTPTINLCATKICSHYAECKVENAVAKCVCSSVCADVHEPVCGSDGMTYKNECTLKMISCKVQRNITVAKRGICTVPTTPTINPCSTKICSHYAKCEAASGIAKCVCSTLCADVNEPVCGSDGMTYKNECTLKMTSCKVQTEITVARKGICDTPCNLVDCCCGATCKFQNNIAKCQCSFNCTEQHNPVCGSDGNTYSNECKLRLVACQNGSPTLKEVSKGPCPVKPTPTPNPCSWGKCAFHATCTVVQNQPKCVCPSLCPTVSALVCGSDDHTYENECSLKRTSCKEQRRITVVRKGMCGTSNAEQPTSCPRPKVCPNLCNNKECPRGQMCCCKGCGYACTVPRISFGRKICPNDPLACRSDRDCRNGRCCPDGCTTRCVA